MAGVLVPVKKAAERLSISKSSVYNLMDGGQLPWIRVGSARRVRDTDIDAFIERNTHGGHAAATVEPEAPTNKLTVDPACIGGHLHVPPPKAERNGKPAKAKAKAKGCRRRAAQAGA